MICLQWHVWGDPTKRSEATIDRTHAETVVAESIHYNLAKIDYLLHIF
jgi:hypothetical protein